MGEKEFPSRTKKKKKIEAKEKKGREKKKLPLSMIQNPSRVHISTFCCASLQNVDFRPLQTPRVWESVCISKLVERTSGPNRSVPECRTQTRTPLRRV
jgi:hypothetical protein